MPTPLAVCLEDLDAPSEDARFVQCTVLPGRDPGLSLDARGRPLWCGDGGACDLWVSLDDRLILWRPAGAPGVAVRRGGRSLDAPFEKPVVLLDQDVVEVGGRRLRVHVHGEAPAAAPPTPFLREVVAAASRAAAAVAIGGAMMLGCNDVPDFLKPVEVLAQPPKVAAPRPPDPALAPVPPTLTPDVIEPRDVPQPKDVPDVRDVPKARDVPDVRDVPPARRPPPIQVLPHPPAPMPPPRPPAPPTPPKPGLAAPAEPAPDVEKSR